MATFLQSTEKLQSGCGVGQCRTLLLPGKRNTHSDQAQLETRGPHTQRVATKPCFCQGQCRVIPESYGAVYEPLLKAKALLGYLQSISAACRSREAIQRPLEALLELVIPAAC